MTNWINGLFGANLSPAISFFLLFAAIIAGVLFLIWMARRLMGGTFVSGGKSRQLRLAVMDATPVDSRRRLVLVRRDDVEHLILIGGPTDVVVEQNIRLNGSALPKPASEAASRPEMASIAPQRPAEPVRAPEIRHAEPYSRPTPPPPLPPRPVQVTPPRPPMQPAQAAPSPMAARPAPVMPTVSPPQPRPVTPPAPRVEPVAVTPAQPPVQRSEPLLPPVVAPPPHRLEPQVEKPPLSPTDDLADLDDALLADLSESLAFNDDGGAPDISLEKEMESLLDTLDPKADRIS